MKLLQLIFVPKAHCHGRKYLHRRRNCYAGKVSGNKWSLPKNEVETTISRREKEYQYSLANQQLIDLSSGLFRRTDLRKIKIILYILRDY